MDVLVIAAHPDDEVLGCGGTIARLTAEGRRCAIAILGEGMTSRSSNREAVEPDEVARLHARSVEVGRLLGAQDVVLCGLPDNRFDSLALLDVVKLVEGLLERFTPRVVYTHHGGDLNIDHVVAHRAVLTASRPATSAGVREILTFEVASSTEWAFHQFAPAFRPNVFVDIGDTLETKVRAFALYDSEARPFPHPRSAEALRAIARRWGSVVAMPAAEAFESVRELR